MSERDPLDELSRALFEAAREERPRAPVRPRASDAKLAARVDVREPSGARPLALRPESGAESERARRFGAFGYAGTALAVAACAMIVWTLARHEQEATAPSLRADEAERVPRATNAPRRAPAPATTSSTPAPERSAIARSQSEPSPRPRASAGVKLPPATLSEELALLDQARSALAGGDAPSALALLDRYDTKLRATHLNAEAALMRIEALSKSGRADEARQRARRFIELFPDSPLADRARAWLGSANATADSLETQGSAL